MAPATRVERLPLPQIGAIIEAHGSCAAIDRSSTAVASRPISLVGPCAASSFNDAIAPGVPICSSSDTARLTPIASLTFGSRSTSSFVSRRRRWRLLIGTGFGNLIEVDDGLHASQILRQHRDGAVGSFEQGENRFIGRRTIFSHEILPEAAEVAIRPAAGGPQVPQVADAVRSAAHK